jgi:hypothetical protein
LLTGGGGVGGGSSGVTFGFGSSTGLLVVLGPLHPTRIPKSMDKARRVSTRGQ